MWITVETSVKAPIAKVWKYWTAPEHIVQWNFASDEWHCPSAINELQPKGQLNWRMEAKDGSFGFDFTGEYEEIKENELITYHMSDGRKVKITLTEKNGVVQLSESFEAEGTNSDEMQKAGWQAILGNFKKHVEEG